MVEHLVGASLEEIAARKVFEPLAMASSTFEWSADDPHPLKPLVEVAEGVSWGLGWGLEESGGGPLFWHWGDNGDYRCHVMASAASDNGLVLFTNSNNGLAIAELFFEEVFGAGHPAFGWMGYDRYDATGFEIRRRLVAAGLEEGAEGVAAAVAELGERTPKEDLTERLSRRSRPESR